MFKHLRVLSLISLIIVSGFSLLAGTIFRDMAVNELTYFVDRGNESYVKGYVGSVWNEYAKAIDAINNKTPQEIKAEPEVIELAQHTLQYFANMPIVRVNIYNAKGLLILSNPKIEVGQSSSPDINFAKDKFSLPSISNQTIYGYKVASNTNAIVRQTILPINIMQNGKASQSTGVVEIITDLTEHFDKINKLPLVMILYIIFIFSTFVIVIITIAKRTEAIIAMQHEANVELAATAVIAKAESQDKSQFLANISHELRTPLNAIIGFSEIIKSSDMRESDGQKFDEYINDIHSSGTHLLSLINDILDYSKATAGKLELEVAEANLNKLVHNCVRLVTPRAEAAKVLLTEALPNEQLSIVTDSKKFKQIMLNLLSNAIKFTNQGGEIVISAWANLHDETYTFEIRDNGIGISPKDISKAMSAFGQVDSALSRKYDGTGLGLPLTKKIVELMGGKFTIESQVGCGTTVTFSVPMKVKGKELN